MNVTLDMDLGSTQTALTEATFVTLGYEFSLWAVIYLMCSVYWNRRKKNKNNNNNEEAETLL